VVVRGVLAIVGVAITVAACSARQPQPIYSDAGRPPVAPEACDKPSCEAVIGNWTGTGDGKTPVFSYGTSKGEAGMLHLQWASSSPLSLRVYNTQSPIPPVPIFSGTQPNGEASISTAPGNYYAAVNTNGSWTVTASQSVANKQFVEAQMSTQATATTVSAPASNARCFTGPGLPLCVPADQIWYKSATEWYNPSTYCNWGREQLPARLQKVCSDLDQRYPPKKSNWRRMEADNGAAYAIDLSSISHLYQCGGCADAVVCIVDSDRCPPQNMRRFRFDCHGHYMDIDGGRSLQMAPPRSVVGQMAALACVGAKKY
jgi:hypothetical protein